MDTLSFACRTVIIPVGMAFFLASCAHFPVFIVHHDPLNAEEYTRLGTTYESQGLLENAIDQYKAALKEDSNYAPAWMAFGDVSFEAGDLKNAKRSFRRVLKLAPHDAGASNNLAMVYLAQNIKLDKAARLAEKALSESKPPLKPYILDTLAHVYLRQKRYLKARAALEEAQATASNNAPLRKHLLQMQAFINAIQN